MDVFPLLSGRRAAGNGEGRGGAGNWSDGGNDAGVYGDGHGARIGWVTGDRNGCVGRGLSGMDGDGRLDSRDAVGACKREGDLRVGERGIAHDNGGVWNDGLRRCARRGRGHSSDGAVWVQHHEKSRIRNRDLRNEKSWRPSVSGDITTLSLMNSLARIYDATTVTVNANAVEATDGETVQEILGSGDAGNAALEFTLKQSPLTYVTVRDHL